MNWWGHDNRFYGYTFPVPYVVALWRQGKSRTISYHISYPRPRRIRYQKEPISYQRGESRTKGEETVRAVYKRPLLQQDSSFFPEIYNWMDLKLESGTSRTSWWKSALIRARKWEKAKNRRTRKATVLSKKATALTKKVIAFLDLPFLNLPFRPRTDETSVA